MLYTTNQFGGGTQKRLARYQKRFDHILNKQTQQCKQSCHVPKKSHQKCGELSTSYEPVRDFDDLLVQNRRKEMQITQRMGESLKGRKRELARYKQRYDHILNKEKCQLLCLVPKRRQVRQPKCDVSWTSYDSLREFDDLLAKHRMKEMQMEQKVEESLKGRNFNDLIARYKAELNIQAEETTSKSDDFDKLMKSMNDKYRWKCLVNKSGLQNTTGNCPLEPPNNIHVRSMQDIKIDMFRSEQGHQKSNGSAAHSDSDEFQIKSVMERIRQKLQIPDDEERVASCTTSEHCDESPHEQQCEASNSDEIEPNDKGTVTNQKIVVQKVAEVIKHQSNVIKEQTLGISEYHNKCRLLERQNKELLDTVDTLRCEKGNWKEDSDPMVEELIDELRLQQKTLQGEIGGVQDKNDAQFGDAIREQIRTLEKLHGSRKFSHKPMTSKYILEDIHVLMKEESATQCGSHPDKDHVDKIPVDHNPRDSDTPESVHILCAPDTTRADKMSVETKVSNESDDRRKADLIKHQIQMIEEHGIGLSKEHTKCRSLEQQNRFLPDIICLLRRMEDSRKHEQNRLHNAVQGCHGSSAHQQDQKSLQVHFERQPISVPGAMRQESGEKKKTSEETIDLSTNNQPVDHTSDQIRTIFKDNNAEVDSRCDYWIELEHNAVEAFIIKDAANY